ncbi:helix-turn-helix transcriptional regulator [Streptococcus sp. sy018]|uniref:helix-turn-helix transcriptional regulator n=1 Tax=Streptococcus sp. sy018 TaxID=2600147 RepID=UPI0011B7F4B6|nr:helix-turn-helix transcriptional regulator [Streptococcus sp. sy018]TWS94677.1 helix-turn-helix transcriptional regulator [Streptococcus sp. sy018]
MNRLKELRQEKGLTQQELADITDVTKRTYIYWEKGERQIKPDKAQALADYFGVSVGYLLGYSEYRDSQEASYQLHKQDPNDPYILVKARISAILGDNMLEELERQYVTGSYDDPDFSILVSFLSAVNSLVYTPEEEMLLNYGILPKTDKKIINNLITEMAEKVKNPQQEEKKWEF